MSQKKEHSPVKIPKHRFREFQGDLSQWCLWDYVVANNAWIYKNRELFWKGVNIVWVSNLYNISSIDGQIFSSVPLTEDEITNYTLKENDLLYSESSLVKEWIAKTLYVTKNWEWIAFSWHTRRYSIDQKKIISPYLYYQLNSFSCRKAIMRVATQTAMTGITMKDYFWIKIHLTSLPEQSKIASFLSSVDTRIEQLQEKKTLLEEYKKWVMQKIFAREIRFRDENGKEYGEWEEKRLEEVAVVKWWKRIPKGFQLQSENNWYPYITVSDMKNKTVSLQNIRYVPIQILNEIRNYKISTKDIFISVAWTLGVVGIIPKELEGANLTENANKITNIKCSQLFLLYFLSSSLFANYIRNSSTVWAQPKLAIYAINNFTILLPSLPEQVKIASFLSEIDSKIQSANEQLEEAEKWKKGLLQGMFV